jgi:hypothetical protein
MVIGKEKSYLKTVRLDDILDGSSCVRDNIRVWI